MRLTMKERRSVVRVVASRYQKGGKKHKGNILKEFMELSICDEITVSSQG